MQRMPAKVVRTMAVLVGGSMPAGWWPMPPAPSAEILPVGTIGPDGVGYFGCGDEIVGLMADRLERQDH